MTAASDTASTQSAAVSDAAGRYFFPRVEFDTYLVTVDAPGYEQQQALVTVSSGSIATLNIRVTKKVLGRVTAHATQGHPASVSVIGVMMSRSWTVNVFQAFTPTWYRDLGYGPEFYGPLAATLVLASAAGTVGCGTLADRYGRRTVIVATLVLSVPAILLYTLFPGPWAFATGILIGFLAASTAPLMLLMAQQLMASRAGLASGLVMGLGFVTGAIGIPINGAIADSIGLQQSLMTHVILVVITIGLAWFLPSEVAMERYSELEEVQQARPAPGVR